MTDQEPQQKARSGGRGFALYASIGSQLLALIRNVVVARFLGPEEFGLAAVIILTLSFLDALSNAGAHNLLVQAKDEDAPRLLAAAHAVTLSRGILSGVALLIAAVVGWGASASELSPFAFLAVGVAAIITGFAHQGVKLLQRNGDFRRDSIVQLSADLGSVAIAAPVAIFTHSHLAIPAGLLFRACVLVLLSHRLSPQTYEISWRRDYLGRFWTFGWPLLINGPLLFLSAQADRLIITKELGLAALGLYSAVILLVMSPSSALLRWLGSTHIPSLAKAFHKDAALRPVGTTYTYTVLMLTCALVMFLGFAAVGDLAVRLLYGTKFETPVGLVAAIGCLQTVRFLRAWPSTLSLSVGANTGILVATVVRLISLPIGYLGFIALNGLWGLVLGFIVGEVVALVVSLVIVNRNAVRPTTTGFWSVCLYLLIATLVLAGLQILDMHPAVRIAALIAVTLVATPLMAFTVSGQQTRALGQRLRSRLLRRRADR